MQLKPGRDQVPPPPPSLPLFCAGTLVQKNPRAHKNKIGTPPPPQNPPPPLKEEFYGHGFSCRKNAFFQAPIKLAQPFPAPELRTKNFTDTRIFVISGHYSRDGIESVNVNASDS